MAETGPMTKRALLIRQNDAHPLYTLSLTADELLEIAEISRVSRDDVGDLIGYQREEVKSHVNEIVEYLDGDDILFPNPIIIALNSGVKFRASRGPGGGDERATTGWLEIARPADGRPKPGWIVDGQQRTLALSKSKRHDFPVPVNAFIADDVELQRDQFLRINNAKPLPRGLVTELLPEVATTLPPRLAARKIPSELCDLLNRQEESPFLGLIRRSSSTKKDKKEAVVQDTSVINMLQESLTSASGCLFPYRNLATNETDFESIWHLLHLFWAGVRETFPEAWGKPPKESRLMGGVGIRSMGRLMDRMMGSVNPYGPAGHKFVRHELGLIAPLCAWTDGKWEGLGIAWNDLENTPRDIRKLSNYIVREYVAAKMGAA